MGGVESTTEKLHGAINIKNAFVDGHERFRKENGGGVGGGGAGRRNWSRENAQKHLGAQRGEVIEDLRREVLESCVVRHTGVLGGFQSCRCGEMRIG